MFRRRLILGAIVALAAMPTAAHAGARTEVIGGTLFITDSPGQSLAVEVATNGISVWPLGVPTPTNLFVYSNGELEAGLGCGGSPTAPARGRTTQCTGVTDIVVDMGDGDDGFYNSMWPGLPIEVNLGAGNDLFWTDAWDRPVVLGGPGADRLECSTCAVADGGTGPDVIQAGHVTNAADGDRDEIKCEAQPADAVVHSDEHDAVHETCGVPQPPNTVGHCAPTGPTSQECLANSPDETATYRCRYDSEPWFDCEKNTHYERTNLSLGEHVFEAVATSPVTGQDPTPMRERFVVETTPPEVISVEPGPRATGVSVDATVRVTFDEGPPELDWETTWQSAELRDPVGNKVPAQIGLGSDAWDVLVLNPTGPLQPGTTYTLVVRPQDYRGNVSTFTSVFTTKSVAPPEVIQTSPAANATNIPVTTRIEVTFSEEMNHAATEKAFSLSPAVAGSFSWEGAKLVFTPSQPLASRTKYRATISTAATNTSGRALASTHAWSFTTGRR